MNKGTEFAEDSPPRSLCPLRRAIFPTHLLHVNHLPACVQGSVHPNFLAVKLLHFILMIDIVRRSGGRVLQHILVTLLYDGPGEGLSACLVGWLSLRSLRSTLTRRGLIWGLMAGLVRRLPRSRGLRVG